MTEIQCMSYHRWLNTTYVAFGGCRYGQLSTSLRYSYALFTAGSNRCSSITVLRLDSGNITDAGSRLPGYTYWFLIRLSSESTCREPCIFPFSALRHESALAVVPVRLKSSSQTSIDCSGKFAAANILMHNSLALSLLQALSFEMQSGPTQHSSVWGNSGILNDFLPSPCCRIKFLRQRNYRRHSLTRRA